MSFFAVLFALLIEQVKPLPRGNVVHDALTGWMRWTGRNFDAGRDRTCLGRLVRHGAGAGARCAGASTWPLPRQRAARRWSFDVAVLYLTLGFRQFSHYFTDIRDALSAATKPRRAGCSPSGAISMRASCRAASCCAT